MEVEVHLLALQTLEARQEGRSIRTIPITTKLGRVPCNATGLAFSGGASEDFVGMPARCRS
jgi:hypothetical protein